MKQIITSIAIVAILVACDGAKPEKTIENLKMAITGESNASAAYAKFAEKAVVDSMFNIAALFRATSAAEKTHAESHIRALSEFGVEFIPVIDSVKVGTTLENLAKSKENEDYELTIMYPKFIQEADNEKADKAKCSFTFAQTAEGRHSTMYQSAIDVMMMDGNDEKVMIGWAVCPSCGDTYSVSDLGSACDLCGLPANKFITF